jgi:chromatin assembly factor 1 subunit A
VTNIADPVFVVPALPPRFVAANAATTMDNFSSNSPLGHANIPKKPPTVPKSVFPEAHMQFLLNRITQLQASSINALVESIYLDLREYKVKKIAIEAKVKEVGEKCKVKKVWVIKSASLVSQSVDRAFYSISNVFATALSLLNGCFSCCTCMYLFHGFLFHSPAQFLELGL